MLEFKTQNFRILIRPCASKIVFAKKFGNLEGYLASKLGMLNLVTGALGSPHGISCNAEQTAGVLHRLSLFLLVSLALSRKVLALAIPQDTGSAEDFTSALF